MEWVQRQFDSFGASIHWWVQFQTPLGHNVFRSRVNHASRSQFNRRSTRVSKLRHVSQSGTRNSHPIADFYPTATATTTTTKSSSHIGVSMESYSWSSEVHWVTVFAGPVRSHESVSRYTTAWIDIFVFICRDFETCPSTHIHSS